MRNRHCDRQPWSDDQIDIVIYDPQYTPTLLNQQSHRYIPAEAVYAVIEAKPTINRELLSYAGKKAASVRALHRTSAPIVHVGGTSAAKPAFPIIAGIVAHKVDWSDGFGKHFKDALLDLTDDSSLEFGCGLSAGSFDNFAEDGSISIGEKDCALILFLFRLLGKLQSLGTVRAIDWSSYSAIFKTTKL